MKALLNTLKIVTATAVAFAGIVVGGFAAGPAQAAVNTTSCQQLPMSYVWHCRYFNGSYWQVASC